MRVVGSSEVGRDFGPRHGPSKKRRKVLCERGRTSALLDVGRNQADGNEWCRDQRLNLAELAMFDEFTDGVLVRLFERAVSDLKGDAVKVDGFACGNF